MHHKIQEVEASKKLIELLNKEIIQFSLQDRGDLKKLAERIGDARLVLMGEATHGTREFYEARKELSQYLITEKAFHAIAIEGDWTSAYPLDCYIKSLSSSNDPISALNSFKRFPSWMWRNEITIPFLKWLKDYNDSLDSSREKVGLYGLDLYCLSESMQAVIDYLKENDPAAAKRAEARYACFEQTAIDPETYGYLVDSNLKKSCVKQVTEQLIEMQHEAFDKLHNQNMEEDEALFYATQNSRLVKNAEHYYRVLFESRENTWNIRDQHMAETLQNLITHLETKLNKPVKIIIWAHNSHVGDARATEMSDRNEINLGQIVREHFSMTTFHLGFSTYTGTVTAADNWNRPPKFKEIIPGMKGSYEELFHKLIYKNFLLYLHSGEPIKHLLQTSRLQRAIGVVYRPETERLSHYFFTRLPYQFDAIIHFDRTNAIKPL